MEESSVKPNSVKEIRLIVLWTVVTACLFNVAAILSWYFDNMVYKIAALGIINLMLFMMHFSGIITWRYQEQHNRKLAYQGTIGYINRSDDSSTTQHSSSEQIKGN